MSTHAQTTPHLSPMGWFARSEAWLDDKGKGAWIAAMVVSFIVFWPVGLALLAYMIWSKKMICNSRSSCRTSRMNTHRNTGNSAFESYKSETLRRLEEEQENFEAFLQRLRDARDKSEFDQFMDERAKAASAPHEQNEPERA
ncbi:MAG: DUF2852 domain-containing protein [Roseovarius sp.]|nr:DUF2852 domain-containing protein [Roseovarius sp.]